MDWTLDDGLSLVRGLQQEMRKFGYHLALGGGVLNHGRSKKDIDLYFLPMDNSDPDPNATALEAYLTKLWGQPEDLWKDYGEQEDGGEFVFPPLMHPSVQPTYEQLVAGDTVTFPTTYGVNEEPAKYVSPYKRKLKFMRGDEDRIDAFIL